MNPDEIEPADPLKGGTGASVPAPAEGATDCRAAAASSTLAEARRDLQQLQISQCDLEAQNEELRRAKLELEQATARLDTMVRERTAELEARNARLEVEIAERKKAEEALRRYARRLIVLEEDLRKRIAMELHDDIGQVLTALGLNLAHIGTRLRPDAARELTSVLEDSRLLTREISRSVRNLMVDLRPSQLDEYGLTSAIRWHAEQLSQRSGIAVELRADPEFPRLSAKHEIALFRITQEALNNASKHAAPSRITVTLTLQEGTFRLAISDDGDGFLPERVASTPSGSGWGLTIMRERAELIGGRFRVDSVPGKGTTVAVEIRRRG